MLMASAIACGSSSEQKEAAANGFYDLRGFVEEQTELLTALHPMVFKRMRIDGNKDQYMGADIDWEKELELFARADLNKPAVAGEYEMVREGRTYEYRPKDGAQLSVEYLKIELDSLTSKPLLVEARVRTDNKLYESAKDLRMECGNVGTVWRIKAYEISGYQDLAGTRKKHFSTSSTITY